MTFFFLFWQKLSSVRLPSVCNHYLNIICVKKFFFIKIKLSVRPNIGWGVGWRTNWKNTIFFVFFTKRNSLKTTINTFKIRIPVVSNCWCVLLHCLVPFHYLLCLSRFNKSGIYNWKNDVVDSVVVQEKLVAVLFFSWAGAKTRSRLQAKVKKRKNTNNLANLIQNTFFSPCNKKIMNATVIYWVVNS